MECFILFENHLALSGIILQQLPNPFNLNFKNSAILIFASFHLIAQAKRLDEANTFEVYTEIIYKVIFLTVVLIFYAYAVWKTPKLFGFVKTLEERIHRRK